MTNGSDLLEAIIKTQLFKALQNKMKQKGKLIMKKFKKLLAIILTLSSLLSIFVIPASALSNDVHDILFDWEYYYNTNPDVARAFGKDASALRNHYNNHGKSEGRAPSVLFNPHTYLSLYKDLQNAFGNNYTAAYNHFVYHGINESRQASTDFSVSVYKANYLDLRNAFGNNNLLYLKHYREHGINENRNAKTLIGNNVSSASMNELIDVTRDFAGKTVTLRSVENGKYLCANSNFNNTPVLAMIDNASTWEKFTVSSITADGWIGFKSHTGKWLTANKNITNTPIQAVGNALQSWECFRIYKKGNDYYIKSQANNKYLCVKINDKNSPVEAYATNPSTWERISINVINNEPSTTQVIKTGKLFPDGEYAILCGNFALNCQYAPQTGNPNIVLDGFNNEGNEIWDFRYIASSDAYYITPKYRNSVALNSLYGAATKEGQQLICHTNSPTSDTASLWKIEQTNSGYRFKNVASGKYIYLDGSAKTGAALILKNNSNSSSQVFTLKQLSTDSINSSQNNISSSIFSPIWPCESAYYVTCMYYYKSGSQHSTTYGYKSALDISGGGKILAVESGTVITVKDLGNDSYGKYIQIKHDNGQISLYAHLSSIDVTVGDHVSKGQRIGTMGNTGNSGGTHLHFELSGTNPFEKYYKYKYADRFIFEQNVYSNNLTFNADKSICDFINSYYYKSGIYYYRK